jgi:protein involved in polysaccharide export with SLBB domain
VAITLAAGVALSVKTFDLADGAKAKPIAFKTATINAATQSAGKAALNPNGTFSIQGYIQRPGEYSISDDQMNLLQFAFAAAFEDYINFSTAQLMLIRKNDSQKQVIVRYSLQDLMNCKIDPPQLQSGDVVLVLKKPSADIAVTQPTSLPPSTAETKPGRRVAYIGGKIKRPGVYSVKKPTTAAWLIRTGAGLADNLKVDQTTVTLIRRDGPQASSADTYPLDDLISGKTNLPLQTGDILMVSEKQ